MKPNLQEEYQQNIQDRDRAVLELNQVSGEIRVARTIVHEKMALFSAGTLSVMFTFVGVLLGLQNTPTFSIKMWAIFVASMILFLVNILISLGVRLWITSSLYYAHDEQRLDKEELIVNTEKRILSSQPIVMKDTGLDMTQNEQAKFIATFDKKIKIIKEALNKVNRKRSFYRTLVKWISAVNFTVFITAYSLLGLFLVKLILKSLVVGS